MGHVDRREMAYNLHSQVEAEYLSIDAGDYGENVNGDTTWRMLAASDAEWSIVLQDDAVPIRNFRQHAAEALTMAPPTAVSFYVGTCRPRADRVQYAVDLAKSVDASWLVGNTLLWGVGVAIPTRLIEPMLTFVKDNGFPYDARIGTFFRRTDTAIRYTWPSLVDHADGVSILDQQGHRKPRECPRVAHQVGVPPAWDGPVVRIPDRGARFH